MWCFHFKEKHKNEVNFPQFCGKAFLIWGIGKKNSCGRGKVGKKGFLHTLHKHAMPMHMGKFMKWS